MKPKWRSDMSKNKMKTIQCFYVNLFYFKWHLQLVVGVQVLKQWQRPCIQYRGSCWQYALHLLWSLKQVSVTLEHFSGENGKEPPDLWRHLQNRKEFASGYGCVNFYPQKLFHMQINKIRNLCEHYMCLNLHAKWINEMLIRYNV